MAIFRVHSKHHFDEGLYRAGFSTISDTGDMASPRHPMPYDDARLGIKHPLKRSMLFGFSSLDQLRSWIYKATWREQCAALGMVISEVHAAVEYHGDTQAVFDTDFEFNVVREVSWDEVNE